MKYIRITIAIIFVSITALALSGCGTTAQTQFYRPANFAGDAYRISGNFEPMSGWAGIVTVTINEQEVIKKNLPVFTNTTDAFGEFDGKKITVTITRVRTFASSYIRGEVFVGSERAAILTF